MQQTLIDLGNRHTSEMLGDDDTLHRLRSALTSWEVLPTDDKAKMHMHFAKQINHFEQTYYIHKAGLLEDPIFDAYRAFSLSLLRTPGGPEFWDATKAVVGAEIREYLDDQLDRGIDLPAPMNEMFPWLGQDAQ